MPTQGFPRKRLIHCEGVGIAVSDERRRLDVGVGDVDIPYDSGMVSTP